MLLAEIVTCPDFAAGIVVEPGEILMKKSFTVNVTVTDRVSEPLVPVTVAVNVPVEELLQFSLEVPKVPSETVDGYKLQLKIPTLGETVRLTTPLKLFTPTTLMVDEAVAPAATVPPLELLDNAKSCATFTVRIIDREREPLVPVIVTW